MRERMKSSGIKQIKKRMRKTHPPLSRVNTSIREVSIQVGGARKKRKSEIVVRKKNITNWRNKNNKRNLSKERFAKKCYSINQIFSWFYRQWFWLRYVVQIAFIVLGIVLFFGSRESAQVTLRPHYEYIVIDDIVTAYKNPKKGQLGFNIIAITDEASLPILAEGKREKNTHAMGTITVFNDYSTEPQRLLPETRFRSAGGEVFKSGASEVIIPGKVDNIPGSIDVVVHALEPGPAYNIDITDFSIPEFQEAGLGQKYEGIYAVSKEKFSGGENGTEQYITDNQQKAGEEELKKLLSHQLEDKIVKERIDSIYLVDRSGFVRYSDSEFIVDSETGTGILTQRGTIFAVVLGVNSVQEYIVDNYLEKQEGSELSIKNMNNLRFSLVGDDYDFDEKETIQIHLFGELLIQHVINEERFKQSIAGAHEDMLPKIFEELGFIDKASVSIRPFWNNSVPTDSEKIFIAKE